MSDAVHTRTVRAVDVPLGVGMPTLRLAVESDEDGAPLDLHIAFGWGDGTAWREDIGRRLTLPAHVLPELLNALEALDE